MNYVGFFTLLLAGPALAQTPAGSDPYANWPGVELVEGVAFQGDGGLTLEGSEAGVPVVKFWRPVLFREDTDAPVAGRMDCSVAAAAAEFSEEAFDLDERHEQVEKTRKRSGLRENDRQRDYSDTRRDLHIIGRRKGEREHFVLSYIAVRDGERLVDIRRNCTFIYREGAGDPDWLAYVNRYTKFRFAFEPDLDAKINANFNADADLPRPHFF
ncbi:carbamoyl-phosphate synthase large subunit [Erythrobacter sp. W53]|uniref:carbamoyl-phosphate synthase large subunit n=1 Tax=Erythrobacter sp. W53 TaxID=3425947 RepID=UPI003D7693AC